MKTFLLKIWLPRLALYLAAHRSEIIAEILRSITYAETRYPTRPDNVHRASRIAWVRQRAAALLTNTAPWAVNCIIEMLIAHQRILGGTK